MSSEETDDVHFVEDLEERANASPLISTQMLGEEGDGGLVISQACGETGC